MKWNLADRLGSQVVYALTGIVLARLLTPEEFGLVGAVLVFQAFASLLIDSGFSYALIQRKDPDRADYSTVLWFNLLLSVLLYVVLWFAAPLIARCFGDRSELIGLSRLMFITLIINASSIVQVNRQVKAMNVRPVAVANIAGLIVGGIVGIALALAGYGARAIVWQNIVSGSVKSIYLWVDSRWLPMLEFSLARLRSFARVGGHMMLTSFLNTLFINIYTFFVGNRAGMGSLGYYTQSDKWSKMGISTISQVVTSSFLPTLSAVQDDAERFRRVADKMDRVTAYISLPVLFWLFAAAPQAFHAVLGPTWDPSIVLFRLLLIRGIFTVFNSLYNNYILARGHSRTILWLEVLRDAVAIFALIVTLPTLATERPDAPVWGIEVMLVGQILASVVTWIVTIRATAHISRTTVRHLLANLAPYAVIAALSAAAMMLIGKYISNDWLALVLQACAGIGIYCGACAVARSRVQADVIAYARGQKIDFNS